MDIMNVLRTGMNMSISRIYTGYVTYRIVFGDSESSGSGTSLVALGKS